jgi:hypothetical protein
MKNISLDDCFTLNDMILGYLRRCTKGYLKRTRIVVESLDLNCPKKYRTSFMYFVAGPDREQFPILAIYPERRTAITYTNYGFTAASRLTLFLSNELGFDIKVQK